MKTTKTRRNTWWALALTLAVVLAGTQAHTSAGATFAIGEQDFLLDGKPFQIRAGELHYSRIPREYWTHRLRMAHSLGLNALTVSLFWNLHEPESGHFNFSGNADIAEFCRLAQAEGLKVILGPGPFSCAEWDFGGLPPWLLKDPSLMVRTRDARFLEPTRRYLRAVTQQLAPLQVTKGGPIIMVRVEGEYGAYGHDKQYIAELRDCLKESGFEVPLFTCDMPSQLSRATLDDLFCVIDFRGDPEKNFKLLRAVRPTGPQMCGEWYPGWFDGWGRKSSGTTNLHNITKGPEWMLDHNISVSLYMAHGGTSFGFTSGANGPPFTPLTTSYDYSAPISEAGWDTPKFYTFRELFLKHVAPGEIIPVVPPRNPVVSVPAVEFVEVAPMLSNLPKPKVGAQIGRASCRERV